MPACGDCNDNGWVIIAPDGDDTRDWIERCDNCAIIDTDDLAAIRASIQTGRPMAFARAACLFPDRLRPYLVEDIDSTMARHPAGGVS